MAKKLPEKLVIAALTHMGLGILYAQRAAGDRRIVWTEDALLACQHDLETSKMTKPVNALWKVYLEQGQLPPMPKVKPPAGDYVPLTRCPFPNCDAGGDLSICHGIHGFVATMECWQCHKPMNVCQGTCQPAVAKVRRTTRNKKEEAA